MADQNLADRLFDYRWKQATRHMRDSIPEVDAEFVFEYPLRVLVLDVRPNDSIVAGTGCIPGAAALPDGDLGTVIASVPKNRAVVVVDEDPDDARDVARKLVKAGYQHAGILSDGMAGWRDRGYGVVHERTDLGHVLADVLLHDRTSVNEKHHLTAEEVSEHLNTAGNVRVIKLASLLSQGFASCVDGRDERNVVGTPGGNAGELLLSLAAFERVMGREISDDELESLITDYFATFGGFYIHTDATAFDAFTAALAGDERVTSVIGAHDDHMAWVAALRHPPEEIRPILAEHLGTNPAFIGCGHIRLMLQNSEEYGVRKGLVPSMLKVVYRLWWDDLPEIHLTTLPGGHQEGAVVNVVIEGDLWDYSFIPVISPVCSGSQMFVNHPRFARRLRENAAEFLARRVKSVDQLALRDKLAAEMMALGDQQLMATVGHLANGLPIYKATLMQDKTWTVERVG